MNKGLVWKTLTLCLGLLAFVPVAGFLLLIAYFLGFSYLQAIRGTDSLSALNTINWFARWYPKIPFWYPGQGGGVSFVWGYPILSSLMVIIISLWQKINLAAAFRALGFFSLPITAMGMYFFVWRRLKSQAVALIAAVFYLLMPMSWVWLFDWGFYAEQISYIFVFPAWLFFDRFLKGFVEKKINGQARLSLFLTTLFLGLIFATHPLVFFGSIRVFGIYSPIYFLVKRRKINLKNLLAAFMPTLIVFGLTALGMAFLTGNYQYYLKDSEFTGTELIMQSREDFNFYYGVPFKSLLGLDRIPPEHIKFTIRNLVMPVMVWLSAIIGMVLALFLSIKVFGLALAGGTAFLFLAKPDFVYLLFSSKLPLLAYFFGMRSEVFILKMTAPIVAAFGIWAIPTLLLKLTTFWIKLKNRFLNWGLETVKGTFVAVASLAAAVFLIFYFANYPAHIWRKDEVRYGPYWFNIRDPFDRLDSLPPLGSERKIDLWKRLGLDLLDKDYWPRPDWERDFEFPFPGLDEFNRRFGNDQFLRLDVSPKLGGVTQTLNIVNQASMINLYPVQANLLGPYWGYQQQAMYSEFDGRIETVDELAKWFGTRFLLLDDRLDPIEKYEKSPDWQNREEHKWVWEYKPAPKLWTLTTGKPTILVIGDKKKRAFEPVFRAANKGALPYDDFWLIQGNEYIDHYSLAELEKYDVLMLFGYKYKNQKKAYRLLDSYLNQGGNLFISSGWQYVDQDWQIEEAPAFFPAKSLAWTDQFGRESVYQFDSSLIGEVDFSSFGPLIWSEKGWGVSLPSGLKSWARPILLVDNQPLVIGGEYGQGKVILAGLNLIGHMHDYGYNQSEKDFFRKIFAWLGSPTVKDFSETVTASREYPDKIEFSFGQSIEEDSVFYFRESFFPSWQAYLVKEGKKLPLKIDKAGPNFKLINLPSLSAGDSLLLKFEPGIRHWLLVFVSGATFLGLIAYVILGKKVYMPVLRVFGRQIEKVKKGAKESWDREEK